MNNQEFNECVYRLCSFILSNNFSPDRSSMTQNFVKGVFGGYSVGDLVEYTKRIKSIAEQNSSAEGIDSINKQMREVMPKNCRECAYVEVQDYQTVICNIVFDYILDGNTSIPPCCPYLENNGGVF